MAPQIRKAFLEFGYVSGIILSYLCFIVAGLYLFKFILTSPDFINLSEVNNPDSSQIKLQIASAIAERRIVLLSVAMFIAMAFGFLGFSLFLIQAKGMLDASGEYKDYKVNFTQLSPGLFVILCATIIIIYALNFRIDINIMEAKPLENKTSKEENKPSESSENRDMELSPGEMGM